MKTFHFTCNGNGEDIFTMDGETFSQALHELAEAMNVPASSLHYVPPIALKSTTEEDVDAAFKKLERIEEAYRKRFGSIPPITDR